MNGLLSVPLWPHQAVLPQHRSTHRPPRAEAGHLDSSSSCLPPRSCYSNQKPGSARWEGEPRGGGAPPLLSTYLAWLPAQFCLLMLPRALLPQRKARAMAPQPRPSLAMLSEASRQHQDRCLLRGSGLSWGKAAREEHPLLAASIFGVGTRSLLKPFTRKVDTRHNGPGIMKTSISHTANCTGPEGRQEESTGTSCCPGHPSRPTSPSGPGQCGKHSPFCSLTNAALSRGLR